MLGVKAYTEEFVDECRARVERDLAAFDTLAKPVPDAFETAFFGEMVLLLDYMFVHRLRTLEGKDGNPANEVRILANSLLNNGGVFTADNVGGQVAFSGLNPIKLSPEKSVLGYKPGDAIRLKRADFAKLAAAYFGEIERRFL